MRASGGTRRNQATEDSPLPAFESFRSGRSARERCLARRGRRSCSRCAEHHRGRGDAAAPPLAAFGRSLQSSSHTSYHVQLRAAQSELRGGSRRTAGDARSLALHPRRRRPRRRRAASEVAALGSIPGVAHVWPNVQLPRAPGRRRPPADRRRQALGSEPRDRRERDEDRDHRRRPAGDHPYFNPAGYTYPPGFPKGQTALTTPKVIVQRTFAPPRRRTSTRTTRSTRPSRSTRRTSRDRRGRCRRRSAATRSPASRPHAYLGNYKALTIPTPDFGLDGNSAEIAAAIDAAVADGMNVINLSLGEPEVEPRTRHRRRGDRRRRRSRRRPGGRRRQRLRRTSATARSRRPETHRARSRSPPSLGTAADRRLLLRRPDARLARR